MLDIRCGCSGLGCVCVLVCCNPIVCMCLMYDVLCGVVWFVFLCFVCAAFVCSVCDVLCDGVCLFFGGGVLCVLLYTNVFVRCACAFLCNRVKWCVLWCLCVVCLFIHMRLCA